MNIFQLTNVLIEVYDRLNATDAPHGNSDGSSLQTAVPKAFAHHAVRACYYKSHYEWETFRGQGMELIGFSNHGNTQQ